MLVIIDSAEVAKEAHNSVKVILGDRHLTITPEGIIVDLVKGGEVSDTYSITHEEMLEDRDAD